jgi:SAM-dependent methyltransferase
MTMSISTHIENCRSCGSSELTEFLNLGDSPLADRLLTEAQLRDEEPRVALSVTFCHDCTLVQITETVAPEVLFCNDYPYYSSVSPSLMRHFAESARAIIDTRKLDANSFVVEAASNDGYMLKNFVEAGVPVLGIDPAEGQVKRANQNGVKSINEFFTQQLAKRLASEGTAADVFLANNVLAHVADLNGFVAGIALLLKEQGVAVLECPYLLDLMDHREFDTIYHQHLCYFSVAALDNLFRRHGLFLNDVQRVSIHGGSLRLFVERKANTQPAVKQLLQLEQERGVASLEFYEGFAVEVQNLRADLMKLLSELKSQGKRIVGYGAAAKGCTMMNFCGIGRDHLDYLVDLSDFKQGRYMTGNHLLIVPPHVLLEDKPDYVLILAWNFASEIMKQQSAYRDGGGKFIVPVPQVRVV